MTVANTLAYYDMVTILSENFLIVHAPGAYPTQLFTALIYGFSGAPL
jgi:hypothetical protein